jgi:glycosyltransferase involved in cell wall biosynthesis
VDQLFMMSLSVDSSYSPRGELAPVARFVSVIVPAYNASATIERTLRSVMAQTYAHLEIIVVDDGSNDHTAAIVERVAREDPRIILLRQPNEGVATARNLAIAHAYGEFIAPLDADDIWHPRKIEKQIAVMEDGGNRIGLVYCYSRQIDEHDIITPQEGQQSNARGDVYSLLVLSNFVGNASSPLIRRTYLQEVGGYDSSLRARGAQGCEDLGVYLAIAERWEIDLVPEYLVGYRIGAGRMSRNHVTMARSWEIVIADARRGHPELPLKLFRWARGNFYRWLSLGCLYHGQLWWSLYYLAIALGYDPSETVSLWVVRNYLTRLVSPRIEALRIACFVYRIRDLLWRRYPSSSIWGMKYLDVDPTVNDGVQVRPREIRRQTNARSLTLLSSDRGLEPREKNLRRGISVISA